jgi:hypothetical protein
MDLVKMQERADAINETGLQQVGVYGWAHQ